ncbi:hypothetical protein [Paractinoplanes atraurantiacus]|uniref:Uncharacterized protein n=1 Tax=Paractinoplanes atraurantiacus TaxID=1036182 RepID=A0A285HQN9_9ACTN|nr:hypothetical protein [Actinoplanes atraurantiacus]SNY37893.1 hypothetical protein SAMN05421748_105156 [Actinoplanes atraurantiacus]
MITVQRCEVRVVRRGGWSWGPDPQGLVRQVLDSLPDLLTEHFGEALTGDGPDLEITEPVRLTARLGSSPGLVIEPATGSLPAPRPVSSPAAPEPTSGTDDPLPPGPATLFEELAVRDELAPLLALLPDETFRTFLTALREEPSLTVVTALVTEGTRRWSLTPPPAGDMAGLTAALSAVPGTPPAPPDPVRATPAAAPGAAAPVAALVAGETRAGPALPFLLAGPLARTGYLDAIGPALAAETPLFAAALAYKVLSAPERGWRRPPQDHAAAAAFAGLPEAPDLTEFAGRVEPALPVLDGVLALSLCRGHDPADPLLVTGVDGGLLLVDAQGMFPIGWAPDVAGLLPHWTACGRPPVLVCDGPLPASCLRDLATAGADVLTDARPLRGDPLSRLPWRSPLWTHGTPAPALAAAFPGHAERAAELVRSLFVDRLAVPRARAGPLERSTALAASLALGLIAWTLWRDRETPHPVLALTRFADLEATVRYEPRVVRVRLPLGPRHADLWRNGLLTDVPHVVWLGGRSLTFSGG